MRRVVVIGASHHNTLGIVRSLGEAGFKPDIIVYAEDAKREFVSRSRYVNKAYVVPHCDENIIKLLNDNYGGEEENIIIFPSSDAASELLNNNTNSLSRFIFPHCTNAEASLVQCLDKDFMNRFAEANGFTVPKSTVVEAGCEYDWVYGFPCIVKPLESAKGNKKDITICFKQEELLKCLEYYGENKTAALVQEYIIPEAEISTMGISFSSNQECRLPNLIVKERFSNKSATYAKVIPIEQKADFFDTAQKIKNMMRVIGYTGIFDLDFLYNNGKYYFIELNLRNGAYGYAFTMGGINFPGDWCKYHYDGNLPKEYEQKRIKIMNEFSDFKVIRQEKKSVFKWMVQFFGAKHLIIRANDMKPVFAYLKRKRK